MANRPSARLLQSCCVLLAASGFTLGSDFGFENVPYEDELAPRPGSGEVGSNSGGGIPIKSDFTMDDNSDPFVRLVQGEVVDADINGGAFMKQHIGRLKIYKPKEFREGHRWTAVCDGPSWNVNSRPALLVCQELGQGHPKTVAPVGVSSPYKGGQNETRWRMDVSCNEADKRIDDCQEMSHVIDTCPAEEAVMVECLPVTGAPTIRVTENMSSPLKASVTSSPSSPTVQATEASSPSRTSVKSSPSSPTVEATETSSPAKASVKSSPSLPTVQVTEARSYPSKESMSSFFFSAKITTQRPGNKSTSTTRKMTQSQTKGRHELLQGATEQQQSRGMPTMRTQPAPNDITSQEANTEQSHPASNNGPDEVDPKKENANISLRMTVDILPRSSNTDWLSLHYKQTLFFEIKSNGLNVFPTHCWAEPFGHQPAAVIDDKLRLDLIRNGCPADIGSVYRYNVPSYTFGARASLLLAFDPVPVMIKCDVRPCFQTPCRVDCKHKDLVNALSARVQQQSPSLYNVPVGPFKLSTYSKENGGLPEGIAHPMLHTNPFQTKAKKEAHSLRKHLYVTVAVCFLILGVVALAAVCVACRKKPASINLTVVNVTEKEGDAAKANCHLGLCQHYDVGTTKAFPISSL